MKENKINIAELLKDCPSGMELDCTMFDDVYFDSIDDVSDIIKCYVQDSKNKIGISFSKYGHYSNINKTKCVIFPKGKTTWEGFQRPFKDGDVIISDYGNIHLLHTKDSSYCAYRPRRENKLDVTMTTYITAVRLATEEEKQKLFDAIKANGYKWNPETKTLEKLIKPKFKVGNMVKKHKDYISGIVTNISDDGEYKVEYQGGGVSYINPAYQDEWELVELKFKIGDRVVKKGGISVPILITGVGDMYYYSNTKNSTGVLPIAEQDDWELVPNKFDISNLKPFDKVLVRYAKYGVWSATFFSHYDKEFKWGCYPFVTTSGKSHSMCIPYEGNEHLLGTTDDCEEFYKTWK